MSILLYILAGIVTLASLIWYAFSWAAGYNEKNDSDYEY